MARLYDFFNSYSEEERKKIKVEYIENTEDYKILRMTNVEDKSEEYFLYTKKSRKIFKIDYNYPVFIWKNLIIPIKKVAS